MPKHNKQFQIRIDEDILEKYKNDLPDGFGSVADMARVGMQAVYEGKIYEDTTSGMDPDFLEKILNKYTKDIINEVVKNRAAINKLSRIEQNQHEAESSLYAKAKINELKRIWLQETDVDRPTAITNIETSIPEEYNFLRPYAMDTISKLENEGYVNLTKKGKIEWNDNIL